MRQQGIERCGAGGDHTEYPADRGAHKAVLNTVFNHCHERVIVVVVIDDRDRLVVIAELPRHEYLKEFLIGTETTGKYHVSVGAVHQDAPALLHGVHHYEFIAAGPALLQVHEFVRDHSDHPTAAFFGRTCAGAHQSDGTSAVNERNTALSKRMPKVAGALGEVRLQGAARRTIDGDSLHEGKYPRFCCQTRIRLGACRMLEQTPCWPSSPPPQQQRWHQQ